MAVQHPLPDVDRTRLIDRLDFTPRAMAEYALRAIPPYETKQAVQNENKT